MANNSLKQNISSIYSEINKSALLFILISSVVAGIAIQMNWINEHCSQYAFFENGGGICRENRLRILLGGPLFIVAEMLLLFIFSTILVRYGKEINSSKVVKRVSMSFLVLLPMGLGPAMGYPQWIYYSSGLMLPIVIIAMLPAEFKSVKENWWPSLQGSIDINPKKDKIVFILSGIVTNETSFTLYESLLWQAPNDMQPKPVEIEITELTELDDVGLSILLLIESIALVHSQPVSYIGDDKQIKALKEDLKKKLA